MNVQKHFDRVQTPSFGGHGNGNGNGNGNGSGHHVAHSDLKDLFEERLRRPMSSASLQSLAISALPPIGRDFHFQIDAELIVYGATEPNARVTLQGEPVQLRSDGTFTVRFSLPDSRQIIPAVAASADGIEERTIVLAVERNTERARADDSRQQRDLGSRSWIRVPSTARLRPYGKPMRGVFFGIAGWLLGCFFGTVKRSNAASSAWLRPTAAAQFRLAEGRSLEPRHSRLVGFMGIRAGPASGSSDQG